MIQDRLTLKPTEYADLHVLFEFQLDEEAIQRAAFTPKTPIDKEAYLEKFKKHLNDPSINMRTILLDGTIVGSLAKFVMHGDAEVTYWIDKQHWNKGIAAAALQQFLTNEEATRPIFGRTAFDNFGSQRVLEKCGFIRIGEDRGFADARQAEIQEFIYKLT